MSDEPLIARAIWQAWREINEICARDGVPYTHLGYKSSVDEEYFSKVRDDLEAAYRVLTGDNIMPWHPARQLFWRKPSDGAKP